MTKADLALKSRAVREHRQKRDQAILALISQGVKPSNIGPALHCHFNTVKRVLGQKTGAAS